MKTTKRQRGVIFQNLPESIREVFTDYKTTQTLITIGDACNLSEKDRGLLGESVGLVLMGILGRKEFQEYLYNEMSQDKSTIDSIIKKTQSIFQPISGQLAKLNPNEILKKAEKERKEKGAASMPVPPPPPIPNSGYGGASDPYREPKDNN